MNSKSFRTGVGILALALVCGASAQSLNGIAAKKLHGGLQVQIQGEDLGKPTAAWSKSKNLYFLTFDGKLTSKPKTVKVGSNGVQAVSYAWISKKGSKVRVAMSLAKGAKPELVEKDGQWAVNFNVSEPVAKIPTTPKYPSTVPPLDKPYRNADLQVNNSPSGNFSNAVQVDLDFVNTDIVQILKALALQSNVNIVTSPDVTGKITVTLDGVSVKDALDIVTALGGVRYAKVGNTYVVTSNGKFSDTIQQISGKSDVSGATRVVPIRSSQGVQIKASVLKMVNPSTLGGRYDLVLPSDELKVETQTAGGDKEAGSGTGATIGSTSDSSKVKAPDDYIVIIGTPSRLDEVEATIRAIDAQLCQVLGVKTTATAANIQKSYHVVSSDAFDLLNSLKQVTLTTTAQNQTTAQTSASQQTTSDNSRALSVKVGSVSLFASVSNPIIALTGRAAEVESLMEILAMLDAPQNTAQVYLETVDLQFIKPQVASIELMANISGLRASILPPPVDPVRGIEYTHTAFYDPKTAGAESGTGGSGSGSGSGGGAGSGGSSSGNSSSSVDPLKDPLKNVKIAATSSKASQWEAESITWRTPMKVLLRGTREQVDQAKQYLALVDIAPKQVAVEIRVMELSKDDALKIGLDWSLLTGGTLTNLRVNQGIGSSSTVGGVGSSLGFKGGGAASVTGTLDQIANKNNLLARPNILLTDGVLSSIFVGDVVRYVESIQASQNGTTVVTAELPVGVNFSLAAKVGSEGNITLDFNPILSILQGFTTVPGGGQLPQTSVRTAHSTVQIKSGETIAIGGLIQDQDRKSYGGIPILKDLPIIGQLFGRTNNTKVRSEVVFFVTVKEVTEADRQGAANPRESERTNKDLPGNNGNGKGN